LELLPFAVDQGCGGLVYDPSGRQAVRCLELLDGFCCFRAEEAFGDFVFGEVTAKLLQFCVEELHILTLRMEDEITVVKLHGYLP
jgi:hypothetical protein